MLFCLYGRLRWPHDLLFRLGMLLTPLFDHVVYPCVGRCCRLSSLRKMSFGMLVAAASFVLAAFVQVRGAALPRPLPPIHSAVVVLG